MEALRVDLKDQLREELHRAQRGSPEPISAPPRYFSRARREDIGNFYRQFAVLVAASFPIPRAMAMLANSTSQKDLSDTIRQAGLLVESGTPLSKALGRYPWYFESIAVNVIRASEESGKLADGLVYLADTIELELEVRERVTQALTYPVFVGGLATVIVFAMLFFGAPMFFENIQGTDVEIGAMAQVVFTASDIVRQPFVLPAFFAVAIGLVYMVNEWRKRNPVSFHTFIGRIPVFGRFVMKASLARFTSMLHLMTSSGVTLVQALDLAKGAVDNAYLRRVIGHMHDSVEQGKTMAEPLRSARYVPTVFADTLALAEETGRMDDLLPALAKGMRNELYKGATRVSVVAEPVMLIGLGVMVMMIALSFFSPYFSLLGALASGK